MPQNRPSSTSGPMASSSSGHSLAEMNQIAANNNNNNNNNNNKMMMMVANKHSSSNNITSNQNNNNNNNNLINKNNPMANHNSGSLIKSTSKSLLNVRLSRENNRQPPQQQQQQQHSNRKPDIASLAPEVREYLFKILVIGELGTGKTSFIKRYVHQYFSQYYRATIGVDFALKVLNWDDNILIRLQLWDIAGQERFGNMTRIYYKEAVGAFLVFDVSAPASFNAVLKWKHDLDTKVCMADGEPIPCLLLANKCDANKEGIAADAEMLDKFVRENNFCGWFYTSAKENINIEESAKFLVGKILQRQKHLALEDEIENNDVINLAYNNHGVSKSSKCSC